MFSRKSKKEPKSKTKKDLKLHAGNRSSNPSIRNSSTSVHPIATPTTPPACVLELEPLPWSEWTWDTVQHFYFRARMGPYGWEYEYSIPPECSKDGGIGDDEEQVLGSLSFAEDIPKEDRIEAFRINEDKKEPMQESKSGSKDGSSSPEAEHILGSVESASGSSSVATSAHSSDDSESEDPEEPLGVMVKTNNKSTTSASESSTSSVIITTTTCSSSGELIVEVIDTDAERKQRKGSVKETSDWGFTSDDEW